MCVVLKAQFVVFYKTVIANQLLNSTKVFNILLKDHSVINKIKKTQSI